MENISNDVLSSCNVRRLKRRERVSSFDCGDEDLNDFLLNESILYRNEKLAVTYVLEHSSTHDVIAFFSLANDRISLADFPDKTSFNRFCKQKFVNEKRLKSYPAAKICRLGTNQKFQNQGFGTVIADFIKSYFLEDNKTGCRFLTVDAYLNAIPFYKKNGFCFLNSIDEDAEHTRLMYFDLNDID